MQTDRAPNTDGQMKTEKRSQNEKEVEGKSRESCGETERQRAKEMESERALESYPD